MVDAVPLLFFLNHLGQGLQYLIMIGPLIGHQFGRYQNIVSVYFEGADPREDNLLVCILIYKQILFSFYLRGFDQFIGNRVLDNDCIIYEPFYFTLHCVISINTFIKLFKVLPLGVPGEVLMSLTVLTALNYHNIVFTVIVVGFLHQ